MVMKRVRKFLDRTRPGCLIDFPSGNDSVYNNLRVSPANTAQRNIWLISASRIS
jgi:hypothetical protein